MSHGSSFRFPRIVPVGLLVLAAACASQPRTTSFSIIISPARGARGGSSASTKAFEESLEESPHHDEAAADHLPKEEPGEPPPGAPPFEKLRELVALNSGPLESAVELAEGCW